jgi:hypothetical protein
VRFDTWAVRSIQIVRGADAHAAIAEANQFNEPPREGYEYVLVTTTVENISTEQTAENPSFGVDFRLTGDRNMLYSRASVVEPEPLEGDLFPQGEATGQVAFEVPRDERNLLLFVNESASFDSAPRFIALEDGARVEMSPDLAKIEPSPLGTQRTQPAPQGEMVTTENWQVMVLDVIRGDAAVQRIQEANQFNEPAPEGMEYVAVKLRVHHIGTDEPDHAEHVSGTGLVRITGEKNVVYEHASAVDPAPALDASLFHGGATEGWTVLHVAQDEQQLALIFQPLFSFSDDETRFLALDTARVAASPDLPQSSPSTAGTPDNPSDPRMVLDAYDRVFNSRSLDDLVQLFTDDAVVTSSDGSVLQGKDQIRAGLGPTLAFENLRLVSEAYEVTGDTVTRNIRISWGPASAPTVRDLQQDVTFREGKISSLTNTVRTP